MPEDALRKAMDAVRTQLQTELDAQLAAIERQHAEALENARREARKEADAHWQAEIERVRAELEQVRSETERVRAESESRLETALKRAKADSESRLNAALADAAVEAERRLVSETVRVRVEAEQQAARALEEARQAAASQAREEAAAQAREEAARARAETEQALEAERASQAERLAALQRELEGARERIAALEATLEQERERAREERQQEEAAAEAHLAERGAAERQAQLAALERLMNSVRAISEARSLSDVLAALAEGAAAEASRAVVLVPAGQDLEGYRVSGFSPERIVHPPRAAGADAVRTAMREQRAVPVVPADAPDFARLPPERAGLAAPILVGGRAVAVLYADNSLASSPEVPAAWPEAVQVLALHASAALSHLTAVRTAQAARLMRSSTPASPAPSVPDSGAESEEAARRYARLLVSEIKLYNESAVRLGREKRDLLQRLRPEIDRARRLYEERIPASVARRAAFFDEEVRQILADGDPALLGRETVWP